MENPSEGKPQWQVRGNLATAKRVIVVASGPKKPRLPWTPALEWLHAAVGPGEPLPEGYENGSAYVLVNSENPSYVLGVCESIPQYVADAKLSDNEADSSTFNRPNIVLYAPNVDPTKLKVNQGAPEVVVIDQQWDSGGLRLNYGKHTIPVFSRDPAGEWRPLDVLELDGAASKARDEEDNRTRSIVTGGTPDVDAAVARYRQLVERVGALGVGSGRVAQNLGATLRHVLPNPGVFVVCAAGSDPDARREIGREVVGYFRDSPLPDMWDPETTVCHAVADPNFLRYAIANSQRLATFGSNQHSSSSDPTQYMASLAPTVVALEYSDDLPPGVGNTLPAHVIVLTNPTGAESGGFRAHPQSAVYETTADWFRHPEEWDAIAKLLRRSVKFARHSAGVYSGLDQGDRSDLQRIGNPPLLAYDGGPDGVKVIAGPGLMSAQSIDVHRATPPSDQSGTMREVAELLRGETPGVVVVAPDRRRVSVSAVQEATRLLEEFAPGVPVNVVDGSPRTGRLARLFRSRWRGDSPSSGPGRS